MMMLRCNEVNLLRRLGCMHEPLKKETDHERLEREATVFTKLLKLKRDTISYSLLPTGLPRSYSEGVRMAKDNVPVLNLAVIKLKRVVTLGPSFHNWQDNVGISPRPRQVGRRVDVDESSDANARDMVHLQRVPTGIPNPPIGMYDAEIDEKDVVSGVGLDEVAIQMGDLGGESADPDPDPDPDPQCADPQFAAADGDEINFTDSVQAVRRTQEASQAPVAEKPHSEAEMGPKV